jgi:hypothetical protein
VSDYPQTPPHPEGATAVVSPGASSDGTAVIGPPDRPEVAVGAAFAGGLVLALILRRLAR